MYVLPRQVLYPDDYCDICGYIKDGDGEYCIDCEWEIEVEQYHAGAYDIDYYDDPEGYWKQEFRDPGGASALRAESDSNPRNLPCPTCGKPDRLTPKDKKLGYQCDECADRLERGY